MLYRPSELEVVQSLSDRGELGIHFYQVRDTFISRLGDCQDRLGQNYEIVYFRINLIVSTEILISDKRIHRFQKCNTQLSKGSI